MGAILIFDEIQTGFGRVANMFAASRYGVVPDIICMAKAMGGGMPLGGFAARKELMDALKTNPILGHITTFGGHPVSCAAGLAAVQFMLENDTIEAVEDKGRLMEELLSENVNKKYLKEIRRVGLLMAIEFTNFEVASKIARVALEEEGLVTESFLFCPNAMRIAPPLTITNEEIKMVCDKIIKAINRVQ